jgi:hypothetical protein
MNVFDQFYISVYQKVKKHRPKLAARLASFYVSLLQIGLLLLLGVFFMKFCEQMKLTFLTTPNAWLLFVGISLFIVFKNWMGYNGKKRSILFSKASKRASQHSLLALVVFQFLVYGLTFVISKAA